MYYNDQKVSIFGLLFDWSTPSGRVVCLASALIVCDYYMAVALSMGGRIRSGAVRPFVHPGSNLISAEDRRNLKSEGNIPFARLTEAPIFGQKSQGSKPHGPVELSNRRRLITDGSPLLADMSTMGLNTVTVPIFRAQLHSKTEAWVFPEYVKAGMAILPRSGLNDPMLVHVGGSCIVTDIPPRIFSSTELTRRRPPFTHITFLVP